MTELLDIKDVAAILGLPINTLYDWRYTGRGPKSAKIGKHVVYRRRDIERFISDAFGE
jgi:predicted DNA-binding transcriptional regulator AlpA